MTDKHFLSKHRSRLVTEGILKATLFGLAIGFGINTLVALTAWYFDFGSIWLAIGVGLGAAAISGTLLYYLKLRPTPEEIARRVDRLGLEERLITMMELKDDDSYIATLQRENTIEHIKDVDDKKLKFRVSKLLAILTIVTFMLSVSTTTVLGLSNSDIIPSGSDILNPQDPFEDYIAISYIVEEGGEIIGVADQLILPGEDGTPVIAVAEDGWMFMGWDDGNRDPERQEFGVTEEMVFIAIFEEIGDGIESGGGDSSDGPTEDSEGDQASDAPDQENASSGEGQPGDAGSDSSGEGSEGQGNPNDSAGGESQDGGEGEGGQGSSGKWNDSNQFIDGNTYYRDYLEMYYQLAQDIFLSDGSIPPEFIEFFESYYNSI